MFYEVQFTSIASSAMNSVAIAEMYDHLDILSVLHLHAKLMKQLVIHEGCEVLINMLTDSSHLNYHLTFSHITTQDQL